MKAMVRTLIVDDEPLARRRLRRLLAAHADIEVVGECGDGARAVADITRLRPDLALLDVQMPGLDGFEVVARVGADHMPLVVFVTAHEEHALRAFEVAAVDYLLKPFDADRLGEALQRVRDRRAPGSRSKEDLVRRLAVLLEHARSQDAYPDRIAVKADGRVLLLAVGEIEWIEAAGKYVHLHTPARSFLLRESISELQKRLDPGRFARIHRSTIVQLGAVVEIEPTFHGECTVLLRSGRSVTLSRGYRGQLRARFGDSF